MVSRRSSGARSMSCSRPGTERRLAAEAVAASAFNVERPSGPSMGSVTNLALTLAKRVGRPPESWRRRWHRPCAHGGGDGRGCRRSGVSQRCGSRPKRIRPLRRGAWGRSGIRQGRGRERRACPRRIREREPHRTLARVARSRAVSGDALARLLEAAGHRVTREYLHASGAAPTEAVRQPLCRRM